MTEFEDSFVKDNSYHPDKIGEKYILEAYIPQKYQLKTDDGWLSLSTRNELRHAVGGVAAHTLRYFSKNREGFNVFRARGQAIWWLRHIYNSFKWWRAYGVNVEGERKDMPMLYVGESFGAATSFDGREADIVLSAFENDIGIIDPSDRAGTVFAVGYSERGGLFNSPDKYAVKTIVGKKYCKAGVSVKFTVSKNLRLMAEHLLKKKDKPINQGNVQEVLHGIKVLILDRERHQALVDEVRSVGAQPILVKEDDLSPTFAVIRGEVDFITGVGGVPEGVLSAMLVEKLGGEMTLRLLPDGVANNVNLLAKQTNWDLFTLKEIEILKNFYIVVPGTEKAGQIPFNKIFTSRDLARGRDMVFTASIIRKTPWIKHGNGVEIPGVKIDPENGNLIVHTIRVVKDEIEIVHVVYKTAIEKIKNQMALDTVSTEEHMNLHIELAKVYAEFGLFRLANDSIAKGMLDHGVNDTQRVTFKRIYEYIKGLETLTKSENKASELAIEHFLNANHLDKDNIDGFRPKRMVKRIYEYLGDIDFREKNYEEAIEKYKRALKYGAHELKLYRKINTSNMKPLLTEYFDMANAECEKSETKTTEEWDKFKIKAALEIFYRNIICPALSGGDPWLIFFRRTVMHNLKLSYKLAVLIKLRVLLNKLNRVDDCALHECLNGRFGIDEGDIKLIQDYRKTRSKFFSVSELYHIKALKVDTLVKLLLPSVRVEAHNELENADIPLSISIREAVEVRYKNILREIEEKCKDEAQEHSYAVAEAYHYVGMALHDVGDYTGARMYYGKAIRRFKEVIEKFEGITPVNAQYRIGNMFEEMALLFVDRENYYYEKAKNEYNKIVDEEKAVKLFSYAYKLNAVRIEQATDRVIELEKILDTNSACQVCSNTVKSC